MGAINRKESRGGHTRDDFPKPVPRWARSTSSSGSPTRPPRRHGVGGTPSVRSITVSPEPIPVMPDDLKALFEEAI